MARLNFSRQGNGPAIVLSHALGCDLGMWDELAAQLAPGYSVLRYDHRGHGASEVVPGPFGIEDMAEDVAGLIRSQTDAAVHFVGLSMGGMVAQQLAMRHPELVSSIVIANSSSFYDESARDAWRARIDTVLAQGMPAIAEAAMQRWFTPEFRADAQGSLRVAQLRAVLERMSPNAYAASCEAVARIDFSRTNPLIACPALVIAGSRDQAAPPEMAMALCKTISGAELTSLDTAHLSAVEQPVEFANLVAGFIRSL